MPPTPPQTAKDKLVRFLRATEKYTKTDMVYLASGGFWSVVGQVSASVIALALAVVIARYVPKDAYGSYKYVLAVVSILGTFSLSGIGTAVFQSIARGYRSALDDGFRANLRWSLFVFLGALGGGAYYLFHGNYVFGVGILLGGCITPLLSGFNLYSAAYTGEKDFRSAAWYGGFVTNIVPALALGAVAYFAPKPLFLIAAYFVGNAVAAAFAYYRARQKFPDQEKRHDPGMLTYGKHLSVMGILNGISGNIDQVLLFHFVGPVQLAIYNFATAIPDQTKGPIKMLSTMIQARFVSRPVEEIEAGMGNKMLLLLVSAALFVIVYTLTAPFIFKLLFPNYVDSVFFSQIYAFSLLGLFATPAGSLFVAKKMVREQYVATILFSIAQIFALSVGVIFWGLLGLVISRVMMRMFSGALTLYLYKAGR